MVLAAALHAFAQPTAEGLTQEDSVRVRQCGDNLLPAALLPDTARSCADFLKADGGRVLRGLSRADPIAAGEFLAKTVALADLGAMVSDPGIQNHELRNSLKLVLPCDDTALCGLGLGPEPEKVHSWTERLSKEGGRFSAARNGELAGAILHWDTLLDAFRAGRDKETWIKLDLVARTKAYRGWLRAQCQKPDPGKPDKDAARRLLQAMEAELPSEATGPLKDCAATLAAATEGRAAPEKGLDRGYSRAAGRMEAIVDQPGGDHFGALGKGFDGSKGGSAVLLPEPDAPGSQGAPPSGALTAAQVQPIAEALKKPLAEELRGTIVGRKLLEFYEGPPIKDNRGRLLNEMNFSFQRFDDPKFMGLWDNEKMNFSLGYLEGWMRKSNLTPEKLMADDNSMAALARALAPVLVHEGTHQTQDAFFKLNGIPKDLLNVEEEVGAAVNGALFVEENFQKRGAGYVGELSELDNRLVRVYRKKGLGGIRHDRERTYMNLELGSKFSLDRTTAMVFGNEWMQKDYKYAASNPKDSPPQRKIAKDIANKIDKYGMLMKKYQQDAIWFREVREELDNRAPGRTQ